MFLVSDLKMMEEGMKKGVMAVFPSLNYRNNEQLESTINTLNDLRKSGNGCYGVNLITQQSNPVYKQHLKICSDLKVPFYTTSLGSPAEVIQAAHSYGGKVYCDVVNLRHAEISAKANCDGFVAVGQGAGGHAGPYPIHLLVRSLNKNFPEIPVIAAGGIADGFGLASVIASGAAGAGLGTRFIACTEAPVSIEYKNAIVNSGMEDIVLTTKISGTPCSIINTDFARKIGYSQNWLERFLSKNKKTKKLFKMLLIRRGFKLLEKSILPASYETLWTAGQSVELINSIEPISKIIDDLEKDLLADMETYCTMLS